MSRRTKSLDQDECAAPCRIAYLDAWREAVILARQTSCDLIAQDGGDTLHKFAAETVVRALERAALAAGVRFTGDASDVLADRLLRQAGFKT